MKKQGTLGKKMKDYTGGDMVKFLVSVTAVIYAIMFGAMWLFTKLEDICDFFRSLKNKFLPQKERDLLEDEEDGLE